MKTFRIWWPICLLLLVITACNKDESTEGNGGNNGAFYIRCKIDGTAKTFNISPNANMQDLGSGTYSYSLFGKAAQDANNFESFGFTIQIAGELTAGTYTDDDSTASYSLAAVYNPNSTESTKIYASDMDPNNPFEITVSEITDSLMTGTFKGKMYLHVTDSMPRLLWLRMGSLR